MVNVRTAVIVVLLILVGIYILLVMGDPAASGGGGVPPPDPQLGDLIKAVQTAAAALNSKTIALIKTVLNVSSDVSASFGSYDAGEGVNAGGAAALRSDVITGLAAVAKSLNGYAVDVALFNQTVQKWTIQTSPYLLLGQKTSADALRYNILGPMAKFSAAAGGLASLASAWKSSYAAASEGRACGQSSNCGHNQSCVNKKCTATMNKVMQKSVDGIVAASDLYAAQGTLNASPYQRLADIVTSAYSTIFNHIVE